MEQSTLYCLSLCAFVACIAYVWLGPSNQEVDENDPICDRIKGFEMEMCHLYIKCVKPLEISYKFQSFESLGGRPTLSKMYFNPHRPLILLVGPYSSGNMHFSRACRFHFLLH
jgi:hypothetical protein